MAVGDRPIRNAGRRDTVLSGKRRDAAGRSPTVTRGRDKFTIGGVASDCGALHPQIGYWGANRSCSVVNFSPVKQVNINDRWYNWRRKTPMAVAVAINAD